MGHPSTVGKTVGGGHCDVIPYLVPVPHEKEGRPERRRLQVVNGVQKKKAEFICEMRKEFMENEKWVAMKQEAAGNAACASPGYGEGEDDAVEGTMCGKQNIPEGRYKRGSVVGDFPETSLMENDDINMCQRYRCQGRKGNGKPCHKMVRTYCACNPCHTLYDDRIIVHIRDNAVRGHN